MKYTLPQLEYSYDALGANISESIMKLHHAKHHQGYVDKLNKALDTIDDDVFDDMKLEDMLRRWDQLPEKIRSAVINNGGGHLNHTMFWKTMSPNGGGEPTGTLREAIDSKYGSYQSFVDAFSSSALSVFGSGWCWLMDDMTIKTSQNQNNPIMEGCSMPLMGLDVWEHAYYLDYKNKRDDYVDAWWNVVDWQYIQTKYIQ